MLRLLSYVAMGYTGPQRNSEAWARADRLAHQIPVAAPEELYAPEGTTIDFYGAGSRLRSATQMSTGSRKTCVACGRRRWAIACKRQSFSFEGHKLVCCSPEACLRRAAMWHLLKNTPKPHPRYGSEGAPMMPEGLDLRRMIDLINVIADQGCVVVFACACDANLPERARGP